MNQIALGDPSSWTVLDGQFVSAPFRRAAAFFSFGSDQTVREKFEITLSGSPAQVSAGLARLDQVILRAASYSNMAYFSPQYLRFQLEAGGDYYYAEISELYLEASPTSYITHQKGSFLVTLHYTRFNYFDGTQCELPLNGRGGTDQTGGFDLINHTDLTSNYGNYVTIKSVDSETDLPAPLRIELENTYASNKIKDIAIGSFHHPSVTDEKIFFAFATDMSGGTQYYNVNAINDYYRRVSWTSTAWTSLYNYPVPLTEVDDLDGRSFRPVLHLYNSHAFSDLYFRIKLMRGSYTLQVCDLVYSDPNFQYVLFPPIQIPPNQLLREMLPHHVEIQIDGLKEDGSAAQIDVDCLQLLPLDYSAFFQGFFEMSQDDKLIDDSFRKLSNVRYSAVGSETVAHLRSGGPLLLYPGHNNFLFFILANENNVIDINRTSQVRVYYRPRLRLL